MYRMKKIFEIRLHGRGGQGAKTASQFIAEAAMDKGKHIQAFPEYGPERAGAPMKAYTRISDSEIKGVSPVINPDVVIVIDPTLLSPKVAEGLHEGSILLANTDKDINYVREKTGFKGKIGVVDATKIAIDAVGKNLPNTPMIGALIKATGIITIDSIDSKIKEKFLKKIGDEKTKATMDAVKKAHDEVKIE
ncbi:2-oxoacid:acceptor oxidoreductase family protein [Candidatus Woesearchaeota archaeon]|nr:2-oxoacid:acceptor oxidoreductase family protein [Candidatus Woesearchaeota archaeon]